MRQTVPAQTRVAPGVMSRVRLRGCRARGDRKRRRTSKRWWRVRVPSVYPRRVPLFAT